jgi:hypothetical protein
VIESNDCRSWQKILFLLAKRTMRIDPTGELAEKVVHAYSATCCNDSPSDPSKNWITKIFPNVKRAPGIDAIPCTEKVTDSVNSKHKLYDTFCKRVSTYML